MNIRASVSCQWLLSPETVIFPYRTLKNHLQQLQAQRVFLTHMSQDMLDRLHQIEEEVAEDGMQIEI